VFDGGLEVIVLDVLDEEFFGSAVEGGFEDVRAGAEDGDGFDGGECDGDGFFSEAVDDAGKFPGGAEEVGFAGAAVFAGFDGDGFGLFVGGGFGHDGILCVVSTDSQRVRASIGSGGTVYHERSGTGSAGRQKRNCT